MNVYTDKNHTFCFVQTNRGDIVIGSFEDVEKASPQEVGEMVLSAVTINEYQAIHSGKHRVLH